MAEHPIQGLMKTAMESISGMVDVNTVVGEAVETPDGTVIIPISRVSFGFAAGGGQYQLGRQEEAKAPKSQPGDNEVPFGGGAGAGVTVQPVGFLVVSKGSVRLMPVNGTALYDRLIDVIPALIERIKAIFGEEEERPVEIQVNEVVEEQ